MYLAAPGTLVGAGTSFVVLRYIGRRKIRHWTSQNEKWQALESVVVCHIFRGLCNGDTDLDA